MFFQSIYQMITAGTDLSINIRKVENSLSVAVMPSEAIFSCWLICFLRRSNSFILSSFIVVAFLINRNRNHKLGKVVLFTFYDDGPLVVQDDFTTEVQTDTRSLGSGLRGEERFEYLGFDVVLDADAVVADAEEDCPVQSLFYVYVDDWREVLFL